MSDSRLDPTPSTLKKLFAYSGNQCAMPKCGASLVHQSGTMLGKVAHICAAEKGGARYDKNMSAEDRRDFSNLFIVCGPCHDVIDDKKNEAEYTAAALRGFKASHSKRFEKAERELLEQYNDNSELHAPVYPKNLGALADLLGNPGLRDNPDDLEGLRNFIERLSHLPIKERNFCLKVAGRMAKTERDYLSVDDVRSAFKVGFTSLRAMMGVVEECGLGSVDEVEPKKYAVRLYERHPAGNPWVEALTFCDHAKVDPVEILVRMNFGLYDDGA